MFPWLHYDESLDAVFCHTCSTTNSKLKSSRKEDSFISKGFANWKNATSHLKAHESTDCHKEAVEICILSHQRKDIGETFTMELTRDREIVKKYCIV